MTDHDGSPDHTTEPPDRAGASGGRGPVGDGRLKGYGFNSVVKQRPGTPAITQTTSPLHGPRLTMEPATRPAAAAAGSALDRRLDAGPPIAAPTLKSAAAAPGVPPQAEAPGVAETESAETMSPESMSPEGMSPEGIGAPEAEDAPRAEVAAPAARVAGRAADPLIVANAATDTATDSAAAADAEPPRQAQGTGHPYSRRTMLATDEGNAGDAMRDDQSTGSLSPDRLLGGLVSRMQSAGPRGFGLALAIIGVLGSAAATWIAYRSGSNDPYGGGVPVVAADHEATKRRPEDEGGIAVPDRDKQVFENLESGPAEPQVERLLPPPEAPIAIAPEPPQSAPTPDQLAPDTPAPNAPASQPATADNPPPPSPPPAIADAAGNGEPAASTAASDAATSGDAVGAAIDRLPAPPEQVATTAPPAAASEPAGATAATTAAAGDAFRIQLASLRRRGDIQGAWERLRSRHAGVLGSLDLHVQEARLDSGTFYRIQAGPLSSRAAAEAACRAVKANNQDCLVVAP